MYEHHLSLVDLVCDGSRYGVKPACPADFRSPTRASDLGRDQRDEGFVAGLLFFF
jgi:hypothetical protein